MLYSHIADKEALQEYYLSAHPVLFQKLLQKDIFSLHSFFCILDIINFISLFDGSVSTDGYFRDFWRANK